jgi:ABC-type multidrug transport system fused ATPase/permease subunit
MATREEHDPALAGLALTYAYVLPYYVSIVAALYTGARTSLTALERLLEFLKLPQEPPQVLEPEVVVSTMGKGPAKDATWPPHGRLEFRDVSVRYQPGLPLVLDTVSFVVNARQRCGIVGRTGAGKSTLMLALFRLIEPAGGSISIDGVNLLELGLAKARSCTTIIPQEPVLFKGTIKHNIDPFGESSDAAMVDAIRRARLPAEILDVEVDKGGTNLSAGERQLLCFARAMLQPRRLLVLDEATSNLDRASDAAIQELVRSEFESSTLLTIAHRLVTIIDYHKILVMGGGKILEHGPPLELLDTPGSVLAGFVEALGDTEAARLRAHANGSAAAASCASGGG